MRGHGIPYVMDNNETFSTLNHAHNLWTFDFFRSFGLTDEAASPDPGAHPVIHTHQGNFPRLFGFLLYALGARSAESQIWITTMTIGTASVLMGYFFFRRLAGRLFATIAILLLMTDYLMFAQWQVNTYRVWHGFLLLPRSIASMACRSGAGGAGRLPTILTYAALFYGELVFAAFVAFTVGFYTIWTYRRTPRFVVLGGLVQGAGATLGLATLIAQLVLYLGWQDFLTDLQLTLTARNYAPDSAEFLATLKQFYGPRNIVFLYNVQPEEQFARTVRVPALAVPIRIADADAVLEFAWPRYGSGLLVRKFTSPGAARHRRHRARCFDRGDRSIGAGSLHLHSVDRGRKCRRGTAASLAFRGRLRSPSCMRLRASSLAIAFAFALRICATWISISGTPPGIYRCVWTNLFLLCLGLLILGQGDFYDQAAAILWWETLTPFPVWIAKIVACAVAFTGSHAHSDGTPRLSRPLA